jgi:hypothetical protein
MITGKAPEIDTEDKVGHLRLTIRLWPEGRTQVKLHIGEGKELCP